MIDNVIKSNVFQQLQYLEKNFSSLIYKKLASKGALSFCNLIVKIIKILIKRYDKY